MSTSTDRGGGEQGAGQAPGPGQDRERQGQGHSQAPECVRLTEALRELRARTGLSLAALAARTAYSKSSSSARD